MKRLCVELFTLTTGFGFLLALCAMIEGSLPLLMGVLALVALGSITRLAYLEKVRLEQAAYAARRQRAIQRRRAARQGTAYASVRTHSGKVATAAGGDTQGLFVA